MSAANRRWAILGVLAERGPSTGLDLCLTLHLPSFAIWPQVTVLENEGRIVGEWTTTGPFKRRVRLFRLPTDDERREHQRLREQLEAAKRADAKPRLHVVPRPCGGAA